MRPYTAYSFRLITSNTFGESKSEWSNDYLTDEKAPADLEDPFILNYTATSVNVRWSSPKVSNGLIRFSTLNIYTHVTNPNNIVLFKNFTLTSFYYNVTGLVPYTFYLIAIELCNSKGCVSSRLLTNKTVNSNVLFRTKASAPSGLEDPILVSLNSYSIQINWQKPKMPNGVIDQYVLERLDFYPQLTHVSNENDYVPKSRTYEVKADRLMFLDFDQLEACGLYSYRVFVYNKAGNTKSNWKNVTVRAAKPVVVTSPLVNIINSTAVRIEWITPLTYCKISKYILEFTLKSNGEVCQFDNLIDNSISLNTFQPFTIYTLKLTACVSDLISKKCTSSLTKEFRTPGSQPEDVSLPSCRLISSRVISVEWLEPLAKNGGNLEYQLIRHAVSYEFKFNRSETVYIGKKNYFLDTSIDRNLTYKYMVIKISFYFSDSF